MRVVGGQAGGRVIHLPRGTRLRPTTDRIRKSLFDILPSLEGCLFLDLFAGSGSVGIEAISRGAEKAVFVEKQAVLAESIRRNARLFGYEARTEVMVSDAEMGVLRLAQQGYRFDVLFIDPPYDRGYALNCCHALADSGLVSTMGITVVQHSLREPLEPLPDTARMVDQRRYGDTLLSFLRFAL